MAGFSFLYGLRFDMTIYRCCGSLRDIPRYAAYLKEISALYERYGDFLLRGRFVDGDGVALEAVGAFRSMAHAGEPDRNGHVDDDGEIGNGGTDGGVDKAIDDIGGQPAGGALIDPT